MTRQSVLRRALLSSLAAPALLGAPAVHAQDDAEGKGEAAPASDPVSAPKVVSANDPQSVFLAVKSGGYDDVELVLRGDESDETFVRYRNEGLGSRIAFRDCDEAVPDFCETLTLVTGWDRETPMSAEAVASANRNFLYISVYLDPDGDPYAQWSVVTGREGIPTAVFLNTLSRYVDVVDDFWGVVFDGDEEGEEEGEGGGEEATNASESTAEKANPADPDPEPNL